MKILITERQLKTLVENATLNNAFKTLKVGDILVLRVVLKAGEQHDYKFKVVEDMGESWKLANFNVGSTNTGFDWYIDKDESLTDSQVLLVKSSKKDKKKVRVLLKGVISAKLGDDILSITKTGDVVDIEDVKQAYVMALKSIEDEDGLTPETAHDSAIAIVKQEFGDIPEVEIIDNGYKRKRGTGGDVGGEYVDFDDIPNVDITDTAGYGKVNKGGKGGNIDAEDKASVKVPKYFTIDYIKSQFIEGSGVKIIRENGDELDFNVVSGSGDSFMIELINAKSEEFNEYEEVQFNVKLNPNNIGLGPNGEYFNMSMSIATTTAATKTIKINYIVDINKTSAFEDDIELSQKELLRIIMSNPVLKNAFTNTPTLMGLINIGDVRGISKAYEILNKTGFDLDDSGSSDGKNQNFSDKFSSSYKVEIFLDKNVKFTTGSNIQSGRKIVTVVKSGKKITLYDKEDNSYGLLEVLPNDNYRVTVKRKGESEKAESNIKVVDYKVR